MAGKRARRYSILVASAVVFALLPAWSAHAATFVVNSTADTPDADLASPFCEDANQACTMRAAIQQANASPALDTITFEIDAGVQTITPSTALPTITAPVVINGTTQDEYAGSPLIQLWGVSAPSHTSGLIISAGGSTVRGLAIFGFTNGSGIRLQDAGGNTIRGNHIGTDSAGTTRRPNSDGVTIWPTSTSNTIGGPDVGDGNVLAGNEFRGILMDASDNVVAGNLIGVNAAGTSVSNNGGGIIVQSGDDNVIGGTTPGHRNVVSSNGSHGIRISGSGASGNTILGNYIGLDPAGTGPRGNGGSFSGGVEILNNTTNTTVGGTAVGSRNVISANGGSEILIQGAGTTGNVVQGNYIGTNASGGSSFTAVLTPSGDGIRIEDSSGNTIGGTTAAARNVISGNVRGVEISNLNVIPQNNVIQGNYVGTDATGTLDHGNSSVGIHTFGAGNTMIGGTTAGAGNVVSGNDSTAIMVEGTAGLANRIQGNFVGTNAAGTAALPNGFGGISVRRPGTLIGGTSAAARNVVAGNPQHGIGIEHDDTIVQGNYIGTDVTGTVDLGNGTHGVHVIGGNKAVIGGTSSAERNVIAGNDSNGVHVNFFASEVTIRGNYVGVDVTGDAPLGNHTGVQLAGSNTTVGGTASGAGNVISANNFRGVSLTGDTSGNVVQGNLIGTDANGSADLGNTQDGVSIGNGVDGTLVGGTAAGAGNVISGNGTTGIWVTGSSGAIRPPTVIEGNKIGTDITGSVALPNAFEGVRLQAQGTELGGTSAGAGNIIAHNLGHGVTITNGMLFNSIRGNSIFDSGTVGAPKLGIDNQTSTAGPVDPNDTGDADTGANNRQNYPVVTGASSSGGVTTVTGTLNSEASKTYDLDFYANPACDPSSHGEGERFLGSLQVTTDGTGNGAFSAPLPDYAPGGWVITATATDPDGNTSEFSACRSVTGPPGATIEDVSVVEGNSGTANAVFTVTLTAPPGAEATIAYQTVDGTAAAPTDYTASSGTVTFAAAETVKTISVPVVGDTTSEADETFTVTLDNPTAVGLMDDTATGTIVSDDPPMITIADTEALEGNTGTTDAQFTVSLSRAIGTSLTVDYETADGTAVAGPDYTAGSGTLPFEPGETSKVITVAVTGDTLDEPDEAITVTLSNAAGGVITDAEAAGTITDDDDAPTVSINDVAVTEGNSGTTSATFTVTASGASGQTISATATTSDGSATTPADYTAVSTTATIPIGQTSTTVTVPVVGDTADEANTENFTVTLSAPSNTTLNDASGTGTINDDDASPTLSVSDVTVLETNSGTTPAVFEVELSTASGRTVLVSYLTQDGTAQTPGDYVDTSGPLEFAPGETTKEVTVPVVGDLVAETANETFQLVIGGPTNATITDNAGTGTITDNDTPLTVSAADESGAESGGPLTFDLQLSRVHDQQVSVAYATAPGSATTADYTSVSGTAVFPAGTTVVQVPVTLTNDNIAEQSETFQLQLSNPSPGLGIADTTAVGTITDADDIPTVSIANTSANESGPLAFVVSINRVSTTAVTATYTTSSGTALSGSDFPAQSGTVTIPPGATQQIQQITVANDALDEPDETLTVTLTSPSNATLGTAVATGTIIDNDNPPLLNVIDPPNVPEPNTSDTTATFMVALNTASGKDVTFNASTLNGTAVAPGDYTALSAAPFTIPAGATFTNVSVTVKGDTLNEVNENFQLLISGITNATASDTSGSATILDNDPLPGVSVADVSVGEADGTATFAVSLGSASGREVTVPYTTTSASHSATAGSDYTPTSGGLVFQPGETSKNVNVTLINDTLDEHAETFGLVLSTPTNATLADGTATGTITDNDDPPSMSIADEAVDEGDEGSTQAEFAVSLSGPSGKTISASYEVVANGDATSADVALASGTVNLPPGQTATSILVAVQGDTEPEADETYSVVLSEDGEDVTLADATAIGTINDDDAPGLSISEGSAAESDTEMSFEVTLSEESPETITVHWSTADGTAVADDDYTTSGDQLTFLPGQEHTVVTVPITDDDEHEKEETLAVHLSDPVNAGLVDAEGTGTITDPEDRPSLTLSDVTVGEAAGTAQFQLELSNPSAAAVAVPFTTQAGTAVPEEDFQASDGNVVFDAGATTAQLSVDVVNDLFDEPDEDFGINLTEVSGDFSLETDSATATIQDDDDAPAIAIGNVSVTEKDSEAVNAVFPVTLSVPSGRQVTVAFTTVAGTATSGSDFAAKTGMLTFAPGEDTKVVSVRVQGDLLDEANERFRVTLRTPTNATVSDGTGQATILDDDPLPLLTVANRTVTEGNTGSKLAAFTVRLNRASGRTVTVLFRTVEDTADAPSDYAARSGKLTFTPGQVQKTINVKIFGDRRREPDERYKVVLSSPVNAAFGDRTAVGRILNND